MSEFAVGTTVFMRTGRLRALLDSLEGLPVSTVYVADVGETTGRRALYDRPYPFELEVLDLASDAGVGAGRRRIVDALSEEYVLIVDSDNEVPADVGVLAAQLDERPDVGGVAGTLIEPERGRVFLPAADLAEDGRTLVKSSRLNEKTIETVADHPFVPFDFIPNATMFRRACLEAYPWDPTYTVHKEHIDFFVGHWKETEWTFGVCPSVFFPHHPGGSDAYQESRHDGDRSVDLDRHFREKWGYEGLRSPWGHWFDTHMVPTDPTMGPDDLVASLPLTPGEAVASVPTRSDPSLPRRAYEIYRTEGPLALARRSLQYLGGR